MMWLMYLCPSSLSPGHKRRTIETMWAWSGEPFPSDSPWLQDEVLGGVGSAGPGFNQNQWRELVFLIDFIRAFRALDSSDQQRLVADAWSFDEWLTFVPGWKERQLRHMLLFMLFPDTFERIFGQTDRKAIAHHYSQRAPRDLNGLDPLQLDRELQTIRQRLEEEKGTSELDFYVPPLRAEWKTETFAAATEDVTEAHVRSALAEIDKEGIPDGAHSTSYDLTAGGNRYPPKLVLSLAVKYATGEPLDRANFSGGEESSAFRLLRRLGFTIEPKPRDNSEIEELLGRFVAQSQAGKDLGVQGYVREYRGLKVNVSFGKGNFARITWIAFLAEGQSVSRGMYPVLLYFRSERQLLLCYGVSEENPAGISWGSLAGSETVADWFQAKYGRKPDRYGDSYVRASYNVDEPLPIADIHRQLDEMIDLYETALSSNHAGVQEDEHEPQSKEVLLPFRADIGEAVRAFAEALSDSAVQFGERHDMLVASFIASLVTKPLVILTGLSGSGKTQIAMRFGEWLGAGRLHVAAVRPDWTGAEALFGYEDGLKPQVDGKAAWTVPGPLEFMLKAAADPHHAYLLLLDEMNLAHVERYLSDVLSGMESGQRCLPDLVCGADGCWRTRGRSEMERVPFPRNVWIVGTVNVDETTYMFSPKVLDRANTFEFRVETGDLSADARKPTKCAAGDDELVRGLLSIARDDDWQLTRPSSFADDLIPRLRQLHQLLCRYNLEFGHRVFYEALRFASLAEQAGLRELETVLDRIVMQKVLPRLHGSRRRLELPLLALALYCRDLPESLVSDQKLPTLEVEAVSESGARLPSAHAKVVRMLQNLRLNQFASFTE
jgi:5-methylcytosine-specific restriction enzyme B